MAVGLMERGLDDAGIQLGGVEAMSHYHYYYYTIVYASMICYST